MPTFNIIYDEYATENTALKFNISGRYQKCDRRSIRKISHCMDYTRNYSRKIFFIFNNLIYDFFELCQHTIPKCGGTFNFPTKLMFSRSFWFYRCWASLWIQNFFKTILARGARARNYETSKNEHIFWVLQKVAATKKLFCRNVRNGKNKYLDWQKFL